VPPELFEVAGDLAYGEYLASECTTCHKATGENDGIPGIVGWELELFISAMHEYRVKHRSNPVMQMVSGRLSDEEISSLAVYFKSLDQ